MDSLVLRGWVSFPITTSLTAATEIDAFDSALRTSFGAVVAARHRSMGLHGGAIIALQSTLLLLVNNPRHIVLSDLLIEL